MTPQQQDHFSKHHHLLKGDESEAAAFTNLCRILRQDKYHKDRIVIFNGTEFLYPSEEVNAEQGSNNAKEVTGEFDQIFIIPSKKLIIYAELKYTFSKKHAQKKRQFDKFKQLLEMHFPIGPGWRLVTSYGFMAWPNGGDSLRPCQNCSKYIFFMDDCQGIQKWLDGIYEQVGTVEDTFGEKMIKRETTFPLSLFQLTFFTMPHR